MALSNNQKEKIKSIKQAAKLYFKDVILLNWGFSINCVTVIFKKNTMEIADFDPESCKCNGVNFFIPESFPELIKRLKFHCGEEKIQKQLRNNIYLLYQ